ncbi:MAG: hypothetical protein ACR2MB_08105 [Acidimicrobiales bacterium]
MSIPVTLGELAATIAERGSLAYLVTLGETGPRVVSVSVEVQIGPTAHGVGGPVLWVGAGRHTAANVAARPQVTLFWPVDADHPKHTLLVDGMASSADDEDRISIVPSSAMLHRVRADRGATPAGDG